MMEDRMDGVGACLIDGTDDVGPQANIDEETDRLLAA